MIVGDANRLHEFDVWNKIIDEALQKKQIYSINQNK